MKQAFVSIVNSYVGCSVAHVLHRQGYRIVGSFLSTNAEDVDTELAHKVDVEDEVGSARLALSSDVVVLCVIEDVRGADAVLSALHTATEEARHKHPSHVVVLSTTMTWAKLSQEASFEAAEHRAAPLPRTTSAPGSSLARSRDKARLSGGRGSKGAGSPTRCASSGVMKPRRAPCEPAVNERGYLMRLAPTGYLEHKRLEAAALRLASKRLSACVVGAGLPYGLGEGPLLRIFRDAWRDTDSPLMMPTCTTGENYISLIHVADLSNIIGNLLQFDEQDGRPAPFPRPYVLAVDGDDVQCTLRQLIVATSKAFGGRGQVRSMTPAELEEAIVDDRVHLSLLIDLRFSNDNGVVQNFMAEGKFMPFSWSKGFVASAGILAQEFITARGLDPSKVAILGPPGGYQAFVCAQISRRYGMLLIDAKVAADGVFEALRKPFPEPLPQEQKVAAPARGKKAKDVKKGGPSKGESLSEGQGAMEACSPADKWMHDMQAAFEAADVPISDYTTLDAAALARILPAALVSAAARLLLERTTARWARTGFIMCDICLQRDVPAEAADVSSLESRARSSNGSDGDTACTLQRAATASHELRLNHVVYLDAAVDFIVSHPAESASETEEAASKRRSELEQYLAKGEPGQQHRGSTLPEPLLGQQTTRADVDAESRRQRSSGERWIPAIARALGDEHGVDVKAVDAERSAQEVVNTVDFCVTGGRAPASVWMLSDDDSDPIVSECDGDARDGGNAHEAAADGLSGRCTSSGTTSSTSIAQGNAAENGNGKVVDAGADERRDEIDDATGSLALAAVLANLTARDAKEVELRTRRHRSFLTTGLVPQVAAALVAAAEARPEDLFEFLAAYLIRAGKALQSKAEAEATLKYRAGLALLKELEVMDDCRPVAPSDKLLY